MLKAILRLVVISIVAIIGTAALFSFLRVVGLSRPYAAMEHSLNHYKQWVIVKEALLRRENTTNRAYLKYVEIKDSAPESLAKISKKDYSWLYINTNRQVDHDKMIAYILNNHLEEKVVIHGPFKKSVDYIQKQQPRFLFVAGPLVINQLTIMNTLFLETFASMRFDVVFVSTNAAKAQLKTKLIKEFNRRHIRLVLELKDLSDPWYLKNKELIKGIMTDRPDILSNL